MAQSVAKVLGTWRALQALHALVKGCRQHKRVCFSYIFIEKEKKT